MDSGSGSRSPWAGRTFAVGAARNAARSVYPELPPLAAAAHASFVLRSTSLDPDATPFSSPGAGFGDRIHFTDSEASFGDYDASPFQGIAATPAPVLRRRRRRIRRHRRLQGPPAAPTPPPAPVAHPSVLASHPPRLSAQPDADGFHEVASRRRWRRTAVQRRPVPANLVGKCFNCLSESHVKADCTSPPRCFHCLGEGHQERSCLALGRGAFKRGRSPTADFGCRGRGGHRRRSRESAASTISGRSASTGRSPSVPRVCAPLLRIRPPPLLSRKVLRQPSPGMRVCQSTPTHRPGRRAGTRCRCLRQRELFLALSRVRRLSPALPDLGGAEAVHAFMRLRSRRLRRGRVHGHPFGSSSWFPARRRFKLPRMLCPWPC
jgi:hypothetical protein